MLFISAVTHYITTFSLTNTLSLVIFISPIKKLLNIHSPLNIRGSDCCFVTLVVKYYFMVHYHPVTGPAVAKPRRLCSSPQRHVQPQHAYRSCLNTRPFFVSRVGIDSAHLLRMTWEAKLGLLMTDEDVHLAS